MCVCIMCMYFERQCVTPPILISIVGASLTGPGAINRPDVPDTTCHCHVTLHWFSGGSGKPGRHFQVHDFDTLTTSAWFDFKS